MIEETINNDYNSSLILINKNRIYKYQIRNVKEISKERKEIKKE